MLIPQKTKWLGFDLDDTLHHFRKASGKASEAAFEYLTLEFGVPVDEARLAYSQILYQKQKTSFVQNLSSRQYRRDRFAVLFNAFAILPYLHLDNVLDLYDSVLCKNLELTDGALDVLQAAKKKGLSVFVLTEGPYDAQEKTIRHLGLSDYVDSLITSSKEGCSKTTGLFHKAVEQIKVAPDLVTYVGDSFERDVQPAQEIGFTALWYTKEKKDNAQSISSLRELLPCLQREHLLQREKPLSLFPALN